MAFTKDIEELIKEDSSGLLSKHESWERVLISDIALVINGYAFKSAYFNSKGEGLPLIRIRDVISGDTETYYDGPFDEEYLISSGDFLIGMDGDFNCAFWRSGNALLNQRVCKIDLKTGNYNFKLLSYLMPHYLNAINANTSSMTVKHLSSKTVNDILLPLPPKNEQTRIVEKLEELLSDLDNGVAELKAAQIKLTQYRQSLLKSAVEGSLTAEWRKQNKVSETGEQLLQRILKERRERWEAEKLAEFKVKGKKPPKDWQGKYPEPVEPDISELPELPEGWVWATIDQLAINKRYGSSSKTNDDSNGVPVLRMGNIQDGAIEYENLKYLPQDHNEFPDLFLKEGDLLFNRTNSAELVGKTAIYRDIGKPCSYASYLISVTFCEGFKSDIAAFFINSTLGRAWVASVMNQTAGQANVNGTKLGALGIPLPPLEEQSEIVAILTNLQDETSAQLDSTETGLRRAEAQRKNLLKDAFSGRLVPQDSNDEPASVLLENIKAERAAFAKLPKPARLKKKSISKVIVMETLEEVLKNKADWVGAQDAFRECGVTDDTSIDRIEELYAELRALDKDNRLEVKRQGNYDLLRLKVE